MYGRLYTFSADVFFKQTWCCSAGRKQRPRQSVSCLCVRKSSGRTHRRPPHFPNSRRNTELSGSRRLPINPLYVRCAHIYGSVTTATPYKYARSRKGSNHPATARAPAVSRTLSACYHPRGSFTRPATRYRGVRSASGACDHSCAKHHKRQAMRISCPAARPSSSWAALRPASCAVSQRCAAQRVLPAFPQRVLPLLPHRHQQQHHNSRIHSVQPGDIAAETAVPAAEVVGFVPYSIEPVTAGAGLKELSSSDAAAASDTPTSSNPPSSSGKSLQATFFAWGGDGQRGMAGWVVAEDSSTLSSSLRAANSSQLQAQQHGSIADEEEVEEDEQSAEGRQWWDDEVEDDDEGEGEWELIEGEGGHAADGSSSAGASGAAAAAAKGDLIGSGDTYAQAAAAGSTVAAAAGAAAAQALGMSSDGTRLMDIATDAGLALRLMDVLTDREHPTTSGSTGEVLTAATAAVAVADTSSEVSATSSSSTSISSQTGSPSTSTSPAAPSDEIIADVVIGEARARMRARPPCFCINCCAPRERLPSGADAMCSACGHDAAEDAVLLPPRPAGGWGSAAAARALDPARADAAEAAWAAAAAARAAGLPAWPPARVLLAFHEDILLHRAMLPPYPERPERLHAVLARLQAAGLMGECFGMLC